MSASLSSLRVSSLTHPALLIPIHLRGRKSNIASSIASRTVNLSPIPRSLDPIRPIRRSTPSPRPLKPLFHRLGHITFLRAHLHYLSYRQSLRFPDPRPRLRLPLRRFIATRTSSPSFNALTSVPFARPRVPIWHAHVACVA